MDISYREGFIMSKIEQNKNCVDIYYCINRKK